MDDSLKKYKYNRVISSLRSINYDIENFNSELSDLKSLCDNYLKINDRIYNEDLIEDISNSSKRVSRNIINSIIPSLNRSKYN